MTVASTPDLDRQTAKGISPWWLLAYLTVKDFLSNIPWDDWWANAFEFGGKCEDKFFHFLEWLFSLFM